MSAISVTSSSHFSTLTSANNYVVVDFYATWCGPCKVIAPVFEQLAKSETRPGKIVFAKVDVDAQSDVARQFSVSAMPTFLILKSGAVTDTIRGADASSLRAAVMRASTAAAKLPGGAAPVFMSKGHVLGTNDRPGPTSGPGILAGLAASGAFMQTLTVFVGLYFVSLFSFDWYAAAKESNYNINNKNR